jgi:predicted enzyme related to lactoylglutathione lyase
VLLASSNFTRASINPLPSPNMKPRWVNFVRVDDAASMSAKAVALGARVLVPPHMDRHGGKIAIVADPTGAAIGLMEWSENAPAGRAK